MSDVNVWGDVVFPGPPEKKESLVLPFPEYRMIDLSIASAGGYRGGG
jgi:hypothetical protein